MAYVKLEGRRSPAIAGTWYPGTGPVLRRAIQAYLDNVPVPDTMRDVIGLIAPHAGYMYSGQVAAYAYRQVVDQAYDTVVVVSPIHRGYVSRGDVAITAVARYSTPLGDIPLNADLVHQLGDMVSVAWLEWDEEHSLEIQLPFLQVALGAFDLVPVMMVTQSLAACRRLGNALGTLIRDSGRRALLVASTDLSHFHPYDSARRLDRVALDYIEAYDIEGLAGALSSGATEACGGGPVMAVLTAGRLLGATQAHILHYANSGDVTGDRSSVVGYAAGVIWR